MVKHAARRKREGLHQLLLEKEAQEQARLEKKKKKAAERAAQQAQEKAGSDGAVKGLDKVKFNGTFGVDFQAAASQGDEDMAIEESVVGASGLMKSVRKKDALKISKQNYLIKKKEKKERKKIKRAEKAGRVVKRMET